MLLSRTGQQADDKPPHNASVNLFIGMSNVLASARIHTLTLRTSFAVEW